MHSSINTSDFEGAAEIFLTSDGQSRLSEVADNFSVMDGTGIKSLFAEGKLKVDLVIHSVGFRYADHNLLIPNIGDTFYHYFYGRKPMRLNIQGVVFDFYGNRGKPDFLYAYNYLLRISMVARTGILPRIKFRKCVVGGAFLNLKFNPSSETLDHVPFTAQVLAFYMDYFNTDNEAGSESVSIDYTDAEPLISVTEIEL